MKKFLILSSLYFFVCSVFGASNELNPFFVFNEDNRAEYALSMHFNEAEITGICIVKKQEESIVGSVINEFGIKAFDFRYDRKSKKISLLNVISFMDKWYIKKVIKSDWKYLLSYPDVKRHKKRKITREDGILGVENTKYNVKYRFTPSTSGYKK
ncbi:hypothetical protein LJC12_04035 [Odoribacter sp. OttesenSCG-928-J03]|nr:hypothetical protein [Odoribacter sp. OttesenSCG-928-J03]MDL2331242.1 hypothetical protein [Odoribacter sp. OttesenSCG-928-A06]